MNPRKKQTDLKKHPQTIMHTFFSQGRYFGALRVSSPFFSDVSQVVKLTDASILESAWQKHLGHSGLQTRNMLSNLKTNIQTVSDPRG
jgi:hypothetical protein